MPQVLGHLGSRRLAIAMQAVPFVRPFMMERVHRATVRVRLRRVPRPVSRDFRSNLPCFPFGDRERLCHKIRVLDRVALEAPIGDQQLRFAGGRFSDVDTPAAPAHSCIPQDIVKLIGVLPDEPFVGVAFIAAQDPFNLGDILGCRLPA